MTHWGRDPRADSTVWFHGRGLGVRHPVGPEAGGGQDGADLSVRVDRVDRRDVARHIGRILGRPAVVGLGRLAADRHRAAAQRAVTVRVRLPVGAVGAVAVYLVAGLPVGDPVVVGYVSVPDPRRGQRWRTGAVVEGDDRLGPDGLRGRHETGEPGAGRDVPAARGGARLPVVDVGVRAAGIAQRVDSRRLEQRRVGEWFSTRRRRRVEPDGAAGMVRGRRSRSP